LSISGGHVDWHVDTAVNRLGLATLVNSE
jgi:hypothetical protein